MGTGVKIIRKQRVCGGELIIEGTSIEVYLIVEWWKHYRGNIEAVKREYPHLTLEQIKAAIDYYHKHTEEFAA